jgi:hypothetical protein
MNLTVLNDSRHPLLKKVTYSANHCFHLKWRSVLRLLTTLLDQQQGSYNICQRISADLLFVRIYLFIFDIFQFIARVVALAHARARLEPFMARPWKEFTKIQIKTNALNNGDRLEVTVATLSQIYILTTLSQIYILNAYELKNEKVLQCRIQKQKETRNGSCKACVISGGKRP